MKMKKEHYAYLLGAAFTFKDKIKDHRAFIVAEGKAQDVEKRLRWDLFWRIYRIDSPELDYLNDSHIDTALKSIMKEIGK